MTVEFDQNGLIKRLFWKGGEVRTEFTLTKFGLYEMKRISEDTVSVKQFGLPSQETNGRIRNPSCDSHTLEYGNIFQNNISVGLINTNPATLMIEAPDFTGTAEIKINQ